MVVGCGQEWRCSGKVEVASLDQEGAVLLQITSCLTTQRSCLTLSGSYWAFQLLSILEHS